MNVADFFNKYAPIAENNNKINPKLYGKYNVKRGLRNADGTGVLVGLTEIGEVHGYIMDEGEKVSDPGRLRYRGIDVKDLVAGAQKDGRFGFEETAYLLLFGALPNNEELAAFNEILGQNRQLPANFIEDMILKFPSKNIMNKLARSVLVSYSFDENPEDTSIKNVLRQCIELIARFPCYAAYGFQAKQYYYDNSSLFLHPPQEGLSTAENFLYMIRPDKKYTPLEAELLDLGLILHAEHGGGNNSAFSVHLVSSSDTDTYSAIAAGVGSLKGAKHGGANLKVMGMMEDIKKNVKDWANEDEVASYLAKIIKKEAYDKSGLIYGLGHAIYTHSDPRAILLKDKAEALANEKGRGDEYSLYTTIEKLAPEVFTQVKGSSKDISANVDFYSGFVYDMLNIHPELYTPIFAISRIAGWCAHRIEEIVSGGRIIRPAYKSVSQIAQYTPLSER